MLKSISTTLNIRNADGEIGQESSSKSLSVVLSTEQQALLEQLRDILTNNTQKTQVVDNNGNIISSTGNALDVNIKSGVTLTVDLDPVTDGVRVYGSDGTTNLILKTDNNGVLQVQALGTATENTLQLVHNVLDSLYTKIVNCDTNNVILKAQPNPFTSDLPVQGSVNIKDSNGNNLNSTSNALDVYVKGGVSLSIDLDDTRDSVQIFGNDGVDNKAVKTTNNGELIVNAKQDGTWTITDISGTISLPTNAAKETGGNLDNIKTNTDKLDVNLSTRASETTVSSIDTKLGETQPTPTSYTVLDRLKRIWDALYDIFNGTKLSGFVKKRPDYTAYSTGVSGYDIISVTSGILASSASQTFNFVVPNNEKWHLINTCFSRQYTTNQRRVAASYSIIWDPAGENKILATGYLNISLVQNIFYAVIGNGTKILRITVTNASEDSSIITGSVSIYREVI